MFFLMIVRPMGRTTLGLRGLVWVERFFAWGVFVQFSSQLQLPMINRLLGGTTSDRMKRFTKRRGYERITKLVYPEDNT